MRACVHACTLQLVSSLLPKCRVSETPVPSTMLRARQSVRALHLSPVSHFVRAWRAPQRTVSAATSPAAVAWSASLPGPPPPLSALSALSPLDGRYAAATAPLRSCFSEAAVMRARVRVEAEW